MSDRYGYDLPPDLRVSREKLRSFAPKRTEGRASAPEEPRADRTADCLAWEERLRLEQADLDRRDAALAALYCRLTKDRKQLDRDRREFGAIRAWWIGAIVAAAVLVLCALHEWAPR